MPWNPTVANVVTEFGAQCVGHSHDDWPHIQAALDTGRAVYLPGRGYDRLNPLVYSVTRPLVCTVPGQMIFGDGRFRSPIIAAPNFVGGQLIKAQTGEEGPRLSDLWLMTANRGQINGVDFSDTPRFYLGNMRISGFANNIVALGNCGGAEIVRVESWAGSPTGANLRMGGSLDSVTVTGLRIWPFDDTWSDGAKPDNLMQVGCDIGYVDGFQMSDCMAICANQLVLRDGWGTLSNNIFDTLNGILITGGRYSLNGGHISGGVWKGKNGSGDVSCTNSITATGGALAINGSVFTTLAGIGLFVGGTARVTCSGCEFENADNLSPAIALNGQNAVLTASGNNLHRNPNLVGGEALITVLAGRATITDNRPPIDGAGKFIRVAADDWHQVQGNRPGGWSIATPAGGFGVYGPN